MATKSHPQLRAAALEAAEEWGAEGEPVSVPKNESHGVLVTVLPAAAQTKLANMVALGIAEEDICDILGCSMAEYYETLKAPGIAELIRREKEGRFRAFSDLNDGWNTVEEMGVAAVVQVLQTNPDPSFALAAATHANKMRRRDPMRTGCENERTGNETIQPQAGNTVVVQLNQDFVQKLEKRGDAPLKALNGGGLPKEVDTLPLPEAEKMLMDAGRLDDGF